MMQRPTERRLRWASTLSILAASSVPLLLPIGPALGADARAAPEVAWVTQFATSANDEAVGVAVAGSGIFVAGYTSAAFPGQERHPRPDAFVRRNDEDGAEIWTDQFGSDVYDYAYAIAADETGVYVAGGSNGPLEEGADPREFDIFVRAYDLDGEVRWTSQFGGGRDDYAFGVDADADGVYVVGYTRGSLPGTKSHGRTDAFLAKLDHEGEPIWIRQFGTSGRDEALAVAVDGSDVYVAGRAGGAMPGTAALGRSDAIVARYTTGGREIWTRQFGTASNDTALGLALARSSVFVVGTVGGPIPHEPDPDGADGFVHRFRLDGRPGWIDVIGTDGKDAATGVAIGNGTVSVVGHTEGAFPNQVGADGIDLFVRTCTLDGRRAAILQVGSDGDDEATGVAAGPTDLSVVGVTDGEIPGATALGKEDAVLARVTT
jgi:hypothetical protein